MNLSRPIINQWLYLGVLALLTIISYLYYSPLYHKDFNSDQAIHVLMAGQMEWPREVFYWGQNRLGSLLPLVSSWLVKGFGIHPLWAISFVNHFFLVFFILVFGRYLKNMYYKIGFTFLVLFPLYTYNAILLSGHPYSSQLFSISVSWIAFEYLMKTISTNQFSLKKYFLIVFLTMVIIGGMFLAVWVSEFSALYIFMFLFILFLHEPYRKSLVNLFKQRLLFSFLLVSITLISSIICYLEYSYYKKIYHSFKYYKMEHADDTTYDNYFIESSTQIKEQISWFWEKTKPVLSFSDEWYYSTFYWIGLVLLGFAIFYLWKNRKDIFINYNSSFSVTNLILILMGTIFLFYSTWNYRSEFAPRYFTPLYVFFILSIFLIAELYQGRMKLLSYGLSGLLIFSVFINNIRILQHPYQGIYSEYKEIEKLSDGVLIGSYWHVYKLGAVSPHKFIAVAHDKDHIRNDFRIPEVLLSENIYLIKNEFIFEEKMPDSIMQFEKMLIKTGAEIKISDVIIAPYRWKK